MTLCQQVVVSVNRISGFLNQPDMEADGNTKTKLAGDEMIVNHMCSIDIATFWCFDKANISKQFCCS